jgi:hypothetical protein
VQLLDTPFDGKEPNPGYIDGYVPSVLRLLQRPVLVNVPESSRD